MSRIFSNIYDTIMQPLEIRFMGNLRRGLISKAQGHVLEVGIGSGLNIPYYRNATQIVGIDPDEIVLNQAKKRLSTSPCPITLKQTSSEALPFENQSFDTVVGTLVFCTIPRVQKALSEIQRVLKSDGRLLLIEHIHSDHPVIAGIQDTIAPVWKWCCGGCHPNRNTVDAIRASGFHIIDYVSHDKYNIFVEITAHMDL